MIESNSNLIKQKLIINIGFVYNPFFYCLDLSIRILFLFLYLKNYLPAWIFVIFQIVLLVIIGFINDNYKTNLITKYNAFINPDYTSIVKELKITENVPNKLLVTQLFIGYIFSFWFMYHIFENHSWYMYILIIILSFFGVFLFGLTLAFSVFYKESKGIILLNLILEKVIIENGQQKTVNINANKNYPNIITCGLSLDPDPIEFDTVDLNDTKIAKLESELKTITYRSEAWMLESVFLGGLAFSGFLTVASANILGKESKAFSSFLIHIHNYFNNCKLSDVSIWYSDINNHFHREDLYIVIMLLCLASSVFFLLILTLRIRLNTLSLSLDHIFRIATIFNSKEEELYNTQLNFEQNPHQVARFEKIQRKIDIALEDAEKLLIKIRPISVMMNIYRTIAIILFYLVLIISGFYFKPVIAVAILGLALFTYLIRKIETYASIEEIKKRVTRH